MTTRLRNTIPALLLASLVAAGTSFGAPAQTSAPSVNGKWLMTLSGSGLTATLTVVVREGRISGSLNGLHDMNLVIDGKVNGANFTFAAADPHGGTAALEFTGALQKDGTLTGRLVSPMGETAWTAERAKERF